MGAPSDTVIFLRRGKIERRGDAFQIEKSKYSAVRTTGIIIAGEAQITTQAVRLALRNEIPIVYLGRNRILGVTVPFSERYATLRLKQYEIASQPSARLAFARPLIASSILARTAVLEFLANETGITGLEDAADEVRSEAERALNAGSTDALRGYEGRAARRYFRALAEVLPDWAFSGRTRRPPRDPFNAAISFGYAGVLLPVLLSRTVGPRGWSRSWGSSTVPGGGGPGWSWT
jgi:CRISPR-associated protein Cas1